MAENEKLECLRKLQDVLQEKFALEAQVESLPADLKREENTLKAVEAEYNELQKLTDAAIQDVKSLSIQYEDSFQQRTTYEKQMEFLSTQREYEALSKQLEEAKVAEHTLLKQRNSRTKESEKLKADTEAKAAEVEAQKAKVAEEKAKVEAELSGIEDKIRELDTKCIEIKGSTISDELYAKFSNIVRKKDGLGVVPVHGQVCMGCDRVLPVQFVIDLRQKQEENEIDYCPYCSRIIWYEALDPETEKNYIFEQLESRGTESKSSHKESAQDSDSYDESMGMDGGFEDF